MTYDIYMTESKHPKTYLTFDFETNGIKCFEMRKTAMKYFHSASRNITAVVGYVWKNQLFFEQPNGKAKRKWVYFYKEERRCKAQ